MMDSGGCWIQPTGWALTLAGIAHQEINRYGSNSKCYNLEHERQGCRSASVFGHGLLAQSCSSAIGVLPL